MSELYDYYLDHGGPPLPEGYSFRVLKDEDTQWRYWVSIVGPPKGWRKRRRAEQISDHYRWWTRHPWNVCEEDRRLGQPPPVDWFARCLYLTYASWRAVTYEAEMRERWNAYIGTHP